MSLCPICESSNTELLTNKLRRGNGKVHFCKSCDLGFLQKMIVDAKDYYDKEYRKEYSHKAELNQTNAQEMFDIYVNYQEQRLVFLEKFSNDKESILEIGASAGQFLYHLKDKFKEINAIELDSNCCEFLKNKLNISCDERYLENSRFYKENHYSAVSAYQVLEHTSNPRSFLKDIYHVLKKGGIAYVEVPNLYDPLLSVWDVPSYNSFYYHSAHSFYYSEKSLSKLVKEAGFEILDISFTQDYNILNHLNWIMNDKPQDNCKIGLSVPQLKGKDKEIVSWINEEMNILNKKYIEKLSKAKKTSNILIVVKK